jgi:hypothetical protein
MSYTCPNCHQFVYDGVQHSCVGVTPQWPQQPFTNPGIGIPPQPFPNYAPPQPGVGNFAWTPAPLTADEVRKIVREEIERRFPADSPVPTPEKSHG